MTILPSRERKIVHKHSFDDVASQEIALAVCFYAANNGMKLIVNLAIKYNVMPPFTFRDQTFIFRYHFFPVATSCCS